MLSILFFPIGAYTMTKTWHVMTLKSSPSKVLVEAQEQKESASSGSLISGRSSGRPSKSARDIQSIQPGNHAYIKFSIGKPNIIEYRVEVLDGPPVNVIITDESYLGEFQDSANIRWVEEASEIGVLNLTKKARLEPRDYALIIDNTGRLGNVDPSERARVELEYTLSEI